LANTIDQRREQMAFCTSKQIPDTTQPVNAALLLA
jgi:hypothetical protein